MASNYTTEDIYINEDVIMGKKNEFNYVQLKTLADKNSISPKSVDIMYEFTKGNRLNKNVTFKINNTEYTIPEGFTVENYIERGGVHDKWQFIYAATQNAAAVVKKKVAEQKAVENAAANANAKRAAQVAAEQEAQRAANANVTQVAAEQEAQRAANARAAQEAANAKANQVAAAQDPGVWRRESDGKDTWFVNVATEESVWKLPPGATVLESEEIQSKGPCPPPDKDLMIGLAQAHIVITEQKLKPPPEPSFPQREKLLGELEGYRREKRKLEQNGGYRRNTRRSKKSRKSRSKKQPRKSKKTRRH